MLLCLIIKKNDITSRVAYSSKCHGCSQRNDDVIGYHEIDEQTFPLELRHKPEITVTNNTSKFSVVTVSGIWS